MQHLLKKKLWISLLYVICSAAVEVLSFLVMDMGIIPVYWGIDLAYMCLIGLIIFIIPHTATSIAVSGLMLLLQIIVSFVNEALGTMSGIAFGFSMLNLAKEVGGVFNSNFVNWYFLAGMLAMYVATLAASVYIHKKIRVPKEKKRFGAVVFALVAILSTSGLSALFYQGAVACFNEASAKSKKENMIDYNDDYYLYETQFISAKALRRFGFFGYYSVQVSNVFSDIFTMENLEMDELMLADIDEYFAEGTMSDTAYGDNIYKGSLRGKNLVVIVIESGEWFTINQEYTPTLYALATQGIAFTNYHARDKTNHSEAMSILGSYPTELEPASDLKKHKLPFTLPNALTEIGYTANYFHANEKEFYDRNITHGKKGTYGFDRAYFLEDMPKLEGCSAEGENIKDGFYEFDKDHLVMKEYFDEYTYKKDGSDAFYTLHMTLSSHGHYEDLVEYGDYPFSDFTDTHYYKASMSETEKLKKQEELKQIFSRETTVKGFEKYYEVIDRYPETAVTSDKTVKFSKDLLDLDKDEQKEIYLKYKRYQAGMMDLDEGVNSLMYDLQQTGQLDDTAFFIYSDHSAYYDTLNYKLKGINEKKFWNSDVYNIPCVLWYGGSMNCETDVPTNFYNGYRDLAFKATKDLSSPLVGGTKIEKFANSFDIIPTLLHLMGYNYNLHLYQGVSMFSELESIFVSLESGIFNDLYYYDGTTVSCKQKDGSWLQIDYEDALESSAGLPEDVESFLDKSLEYYYRRQYLNKIYKYDYFKYRNASSSYSVDGETVRFLVKGEEK